MTGFHGSKGPGAGGSSGSRRIAVGVTGASGAIYAARTIAALLEQGCHLELVFSDYGKRLLLVYEQSLVREHDLSQVKRAFDMNGYVGILYMATTVVAVYVR